MNIGTTKRGLKKIIKHSGIIFSQSLWLAGGRSPKPSRHLEIFSIDIVHGCQLKCVGCPNSTILSKVKEISLSDFERILSNLDVETIGVIRLFNYGEPLLHSNISGVIEIIARQSFKFRELEISTNAQKVNWEDLRLSISKKVINTISISCDGDGTKESFERLRPPAKWEKLLHFFETISTIRDEVHPALKVTTRSIVEKESDQQTWLNLLSKYRITPKFRSWKALPQSSQNKTGRVLSPQKGICYFQQIPNSLYVDTDGTVVPCCAHPSAGKLGNLLESKYTEIIFSEQRKRFLTQMRDNRGALTICSQCEFGSILNPGASATAIQ